MFWGTAWGLFAAAGYTVANACLRAVADCHPIWVSAVKALPTFALLLPWLILQCARRERVVASLRVLGIIAGAGLLGQLVGNVLFQWSLGVIGMALSVPLTLGTNIAGGALLGRFFLGEPITFRSLLSMLVLIAAVAVLSLGASDAHRAVSGIHAAVLNAGQWHLLAAGVSAATLAGLAYGVLGVVIRYGVSGRASLSVTLVTISSAGLLSLGGLSLWQVGWEQMLHTDTHALAMMLIAGICNAVAFLALTRALQLTSLIYVNALNATQAMLAAIAGVLFFSEAASQQLVTGIVLTIFGLLLMRQKNSG